MILLHCCSALWCAAATVCGMKGRTPPPFPPFPPPPPSLLSSSPPMSPSPPIVIMLLNLLLLFSIVHAGRVELPKNFETSTAEQRIYKW